ncbi:MAG: hypothetical protein ACM3W7_07440 [Acidobacteriota bacterium]
MLLEVLPVFVRPKNIADDLGVSIRPDRTGDDRSRVVCCIGFARGRPRFAGVVVPGRAMSTVMLQNVA